MMKLFSKKSTEEGKKKATESDKNNRQAQSTESKDKDKGDYSHGFYLIKRN